jgi:hypothetical protein
LASVHVEQLPYVDEHVRVVAASPDRTWRALLAILAGSVRRVPAPVGVRCAGLSNLAEIPRRSPPHPCRIVRNPFVGRVEAAGAAVPIEEDDMSQYLLSVHHDYDVEFPPLEEMQPMFEAVDRFNTKLQEQGSWVFAGGLQPIDQATTVDNTGDRPIVSDGPYAESKEYLGGFWIIEAADLDAALAVATDASRACGGKVEVRPFQAE